MIIDLSRRLQRIGQKRLVRVSFFNALGFGLSGGQVVYLIALLYGAGDTQMGILYAAPFVTTLAALFVPVLLNNHETTSIWSRFWWFRSVICLGYFALLFSFFSATRIWLLIALYYGFMTSRAFGLSGHFTVIRALARPKENAALISRNLLYAQVAVFLTQVVAFTLLSFNTSFSEEHNLFILMAIGIAFNAITAQQIGKLPKTGYLQEGSFKELGRSARAIAHSKEYREVAMVTAFQAGMAVFAGYLISYLRNTAGYSSGEIFLFTIIGMLGTVIVSNMQRIIGTRIRARVMLFASHASLALISLMWAFIEMSPAIAMHRPTVGLLYGFTVLCLTASATISLQLRTGRLPKHHSVEHSIVYDMAQVTGALVAIALARLSVVPSFPETSFLHDYSLTFLLWMSACLVVCFFAVHMRSDRNNALMQEFSALLPSSIFTIIRAHRLDQDDNPLRRRLGLEGLLQSPNQVSREMILEHLKSPDVGIRAGCMRVLTGYPMNAALPLLLKEAESDDSPLRKEAITALGFSDNRHVIPSLWKLWDKATPALRPTLLKTLLRLGETVSEDQIMEVWQQSQREQRPEVLIGLTITRQSKLLLSLLGDDLKERPDPCWSKMTFGITAATVGLRESMFDVFTEEDSNPGQGFGTILANLDTSWPEALDADACRHAIETADFDGLEAKLKKLSDQPWIVIYDRTSALGVLFLFILHINGKL